MRQIVEGLYALSVKGRLWARRSISRWLDSGSILFIDLLDARRLRPPIHCGENRLLGFGETLLGGVDGGRHPVLIGRFGTGPPADTETPAGGPLGSDPERNRRFEPVGRDQRSPGERQLPMPVSATEDHITVATVVCCSMISDSQTR